MRSRRCCSWRSSRGNNSILDAAGKALHDNPSLFVRGALTSASNAQNFKSALNAEADTAAEGRGRQPRVATIGEPAQGDREPDFRVIPATAVNKGDAFGAWDAELSKAGFAIIHDKILVIDPFSDDCVVATGSHNLGYRASHNNDENMVVVHGHRALAEAYACHVLDVYRSLCLALVAPQGSEAIRQTPRSHRRLAGSLHQEW